MTATHVPVLAGELIELLDPQPGETAVDCTFGGGGHARLVADRLGPDGHADRDRPRPGRRGALRRARRRGRRAACASSAPTSPTALEQLREEGVARRPRLHGPRHVLDAGRHVGARLLLRLRRAARHAHGPRRRSSPPPTSSTVGRAPARAPAPRVRRGALRRPIARAIVRDRAPAPIETTHELVEVDHARDPRAGAVRRRPSRPSASSRRSGSRSTTSSTSSTRRCRSRGTARAGRPTRRRFPSTRWRTGA